MECRWYTLYDSRNYFAMDEIDVEKLIDANTKLLIILGYSIGLLGSLHLSLSQDKKYQWIKDATDAVAYHTGKWPVMP